MRLVGMDLMRDIVSAVLWTGYVENVEKPLSLLIIAQPEHGKSQLVSTFKDNKGIVFINDVTTYGLATKIQEHISRKELVNHIIIPDLLNPFSRAQAVVKSFTSFISALTEEGIVRIKTGVMLFETPMKCGLITCLTEDHWATYNKRWASIGFTSRFIPLTYKYSRPMVMQIFAEISGAEPMSDNIDIDFPDTKKTVDLPKELHKILEPYAISIAKPIGLEGIRLYRDFGIMAKAVALRNSRYTVTEEDVNTIINFTDYINYNFRLIK